MGYNPEKVSIFENDAEDVLMITWRKPRATAESSLLQHFRLFYCSPSHPDAHLILRTTPLSRFITSSIRPTIRDTCEMSTTNLARRCGPRKLLDGSMGVIQADLRRPHPRRRA
jgi:hypothetical protein